MRWWGWGRRAAAARPPSPAEQWAPLPPELGVLGHPPGWQEQQLGEEPGQEPGGHSAEMQETLPAWGGERGAGGALAGGSEPLPRPGGSIVRPSVSHSSHPKAPGEWAGGVPPPPGTHQAEADGAVAVGRGEDVAFGPDHPLVQAACEAGGSGWATAAAVWRGGGGPGAHLCNWGSSPRPGRAAGGSRTRGSSRPRRAPAPPARAAGGVGSAPRRAAGAGGVVGGKDKPPPRHPPLCLPGRSSSGTRAPSSERQVPGEPPGTNSERPKGQRYRGLPGRPGTPGREARTGAGCREPRRGGGTRGSPWGAGGAPRSREGAGRGWAGAAGTAGWARAPGWAWGNLGREGGREGAMGITGSR